MSIRCVHFVRSGMGLYSIPPMTSWLEVSTHHWNLRYLLRGFKCFSLRSTPNCPPIYQPWLPFKGFRVSPYNLYLSGTNPLQVGHVMNVHAFLARLPTTSIASCAILLLPLPWRSIWDRCLAKVGHQMGPNLRDKGTTDLAMLRTKIISQSIFLIDKHM